MPTNCKIASIRPNFNPGCQRCGAENETLLHAIKDCPSARAILSCSRLDDRLISGNFEQCIDWLEASMRLLDKTALEDFIIFLWNSWNSRNNFTFRGKEEGASMIRDRAFTLSNDFRVHNLSHKPIIPFTPACNNWKKPKKGFVKIHIDAMVSNGRMGYGVITRHEKGFMIGGCRCCKDMEVTSERAELVALDEGMQLAGRLNIQQVLFESDNGSLINRIKRRGMDITIMAKYMHETCRKLEMFALADVKWTPKNSNRLADFICKFF
ncbi:hypothetical protein J1N35_041041 [Gossypium stocksii]|uniref:RNase H type-1 domain-containing protein n=1 Tax=Gossypium stocksii TaxID=47602 RepID=A0A9D3ZJ18_9ROSI|nr:hypothetical protein J1N35_041041 [Gossypium stocksii]